MDNTFFIQILRDFINNDVTQIPQSINIAQLKRLGKRHEVLGIIYYQTKLPQFLSAYSSTIYANVNKNHFLDSFYENLSFPYFIVKGPEIAKLYTVPELRTMGDIDLVISKDNRNIVHDMLLKEGFTCISKFSNHEWQYNNHSMRIELHDRLIYDGAVVNNPKELVFFKDCWKYCENNKLEWNYHFLYLLSHLRKHFMNEGIGLRQFMDLAFVVKNIDLDWRWIERNAEDIELLSFLKVSFSFIKRWFDISIPISIEEIDDSFFYTFTQKILQDGVFGFENEDNINSVAVNLYRKYGRYGKIKYTMNLIFPSYKELCGINEYSFVMNRKYLVPIAWIYRAYRGRKKYKEVYRNIKRFYANSSRMKNRLELYKNWKL